MTRGYHAAAMDEDRREGHVSKAGPVPSFPASSISPSLCWSNQPGSRRACAACLDGIDDNHMRVRAASMRTSRSSMTSLRPSLIFESDLTNEPAGAIVEGTEFRCATAVSRHVISADAGLPEGSGHARGHRLDRHGSDRCPLLVAPAGSHPA